MELYPLIMAPAFRSGSTTPWGGTMLREIFMKDIPDDTTGACMEVSVLPGEESMVAAGPHAGKTLSRMIELWGADLTGEIRGKFPLLLKLLDAHRNLSVQVHPNDAYAAQREDGLGKNEAWVVLNAEPGAKIVYGLDTQGEDLSGIVADGRLEACLHWECVRPGDVYYIPAGMVHALGGGIQVYEIQQDSDLTYRFWDWGRVDAQGQPRQLHTKQALEVSRPELRLSKNEGTTVLCKGGSRTYYVCDTHFELCRLNLSARMPLESGRMLLLTALAPCEIQWGEESLEISPFTTVVVPAALEGVSLKGDAKLLMASLPDRERLRRELGYRAENVAGLMD